MYEESKRQQEFILSVENSTFHVQDGDAFNVTVHMTSTWKTTESVEAIKFTQLKKKLRFLTIELDLHYEGAYPPYLKN